MRKSALLAATIVLAGCMATIYEPALDVDSAILHSPAGKVEFEVDKQYAARLIANDGNYGVSISLFPIDLVSDLRISSVSDLSFDNATVNLDKSYYTLNDGERQAMDIKRTDRAQFRIYAPPTMDYYKYDGDGLTVMSFNGKSRLTRQHERKMDNDSYRYYISLNLNNQEYIVDIAFRLDYSSHKEIRVPATP